MNDTKALVSQTESFKLLLVGSSLNIFLPSGTGDIAKSYYGFKWTGIKERMLAVSLLDKLIAVGSVLFITPFAFYHSNNYLILIAGILSILPFTFLFYFNFFKQYSLFNIPFKFIFNKLKKIDLELLISHIKIPTLKIFISFIISIIAWIVTYINLHLCFKVVGLSIPFTDVISSIPFLTLGRLFPFTLNGIGTDEALIIFLFSSYTKLNEQILIAALLYRIILIIFPAIVGLLILLLKKNETKIKTFKNNKTYNR
jgi:uncharacterized membrane protein YbhN (UPF0104 family)